MSDLMSGLFRVPEPKTVPTGSIDITFAHSKLISLDAVVRNLRRKNKSDRAIKIGHLKVSIPEMKNSIRSARADIKEKELAQESVVSGRISHMNQMYRDHGRESELYKMARNSVYGAQNVLEYYVKDLPEKIQEYKDFVSSCDRVLDSWIEFDSRSQYH
ncbi:uncharacterized protein EAE97_005438 [Botrytis byssoidea]|uniref:Uncharacterized protein n=1 Tax=Botrytis byssoidea TaxID=139641 RepID=A0A9P5M397_9HELO|nr:uncharacterized protein EAE97_005438 [Botrytis byssoidea]KAF7944805.1 hypothetical protein EAE97_005438 [Botrytis byssoidea]